MHARKPVVHFGDEIAQYPGHSKPSRPPKAPVKPTTATQPIAQSSASSVSTAEPAVEPNPSPDPISSVKSKAFAKGPAKRPTKTPAKASAKVPAKAVAQSLPSIEQLCSQTEQLDIEDDDEEQLTGNDKKGKKKAKAEEKKCLKRLDLQGIMEEVKLPEDVKFDPFDPGHHREPTANIANISAMEPVDFLDLFISPNMYTIIAENTNLYAIAKNMSIAPTKSNTRYW